MTQSQLAELSKLLYSPVTLALYVTAATVLLGALVLPCKLQGIHTVHP